MGAQSFTATVTELNKIVTTASFYTGPHTGTYHADTGMLAWDSGAAWDKGGSNVTILKNGTTLYADQVGSALKLTDSAVGVQSAIYNASTG